MTTSKASAGQQVWFLTGSQGLYGPETLDQVADQSRGVADALDGVGGDFVEVLWKPVLTSADAIRRLILEANSDDGCIGVIAWMHTFSPAKMWISGLTVLQKPMLHLHTQAAEALPWAEIDMDFMNLNQAAHGDREFGYIQSRLGVARKTVAGYATNPVVRDGIAPGCGQPAARPRCARCAWRGSATTCETWPSPKATRWRPSVASASPSTPGASTIS